MKWRLTQDKATLDILYKMYLYLVFVHSRFHVACFDRHVVQNMHYIKPDQSHNAYQQNNQDIKKLLTIPDVKEQITAKDRLFL